MKSRSSRFLFPSVVGLLIGMAMLAGPMPAQGASAPQVFNISPRFGPIAGGFTITIEGVGFTGATSVSVGTQQVLPTVINDFELTLVAPPHAAGVVHLRVTTPMGQSPSDPDDDFTYVDASGPLPVVLSIAPSSGPTAGGTVITMVGANFVGVSYIDFDGQSVIPTSVSPTQIRVTSPPHAAGIVHLRVLASAGLSAATAADNYLYLDAPVINSLNPNQGSIDGGTTVFIYGANLAGTYEVLFGDVVVSPWQVTNDTVVVSSPAHAAGAVSVRARTNAGLSAVSAGSQFTFIATGPVVTGISPTSGSVDGGTAITISGTGFVGTKWVGFGDVVVVPYQVSENQVRVIAPRVSTSGIVHLRVTTSAGTSPETEADNFTYVARPSVHALSPSSGSTLGGTTIVIAGVGFTGVTIVNFGGVGVVPYFVTDTEIRVVSPAHPAGVVHLRITSTGGISGDSTADDFTFVEPGPGFCPQTPLWVNDLAYGSPGGGFYWDPISGQVWTGQRSWHQFAPQPARLFPLPLWTDAHTYGSLGGGFYWDPVSGQVWTGQRGWHLYSPQGCIPRAA